MKRTARLVSLVLVGALALTACGNDEDDGTKATSGDPVEGTSQATEEGTDEGGDDPTEDESSDDLSHGDEVDVDRFIADMREGVEAMTTAHLTLETDFGGQVVEGEGDLSYEDGYRADLSMRMPGLGDMQVIMIGSVLYMKSPQLGDKFFKLDLSDPGGPFGHMAEMFEGLDPATQLEQFREGITSITFVGAESLQGEDMRHYEIALDPSRIKQLEGQPGVDRLGEQTYDVWFDSEHRVRQMEMTMPGPAAGSMRTTVTDLGKDVDIQAPPASQVAEAPQM